MSGHVECFIIRIHNKNAEIFIWKVDYSIACGRRWNILSVRPYSFRKTLFFQKTCTTRECGQDCTVVILKIVTSE
jgi:hypothetical protein